MTLDDYLDLPYQDKFNQLPFDDCPIEVVTVSDVLCYLLLLNNGQFEKYYIVPEKVYNGCLREGMLIREAQSLMVLGGVINGFNYALDASHTSNISRRLQKFCERVFASDMFKPSKDRKLN